VCELSPFPAPAEPALAARRLQGAGGMEGTGLAASQRMVAELQGIMLEQKQAKA